MTLCNERVLFEVAVKTSARRNDQEWPAAVGLFSIYCMVRAPKQLSGSVLGTEMQVNHCFSRLSQLGNHKRGSIPFTMRRPAKPYTGQHGTTISFSIELGEFDFNTAEASVITRARA